MHGMRPVAARTMERQATRCLWSNPNTLAGVAMTREKRSLLPYWQRAQGAAEA